MLPVKICIRDNVIKILYCWIKGRYLPGGVEYQHFAYCFFFLPYCIPISKVCEGNLTKLYLKLYFMSISMFCKNGEKKTITFRVSNFQVKMLKMALQWLIFKISKNKKKRSKVLLRNLYMPKISILC